MILSPTQEVQNHPESCYDGYTQPGTLVKLKHIESDVAVYEEPTIGPMMAFLPSDTLGMYLESMTGGTILNQGFGDVIVYHRITFPEYDSLTGWVWSVCVEAL